VPSNAMALFTRTTKLDPGAHGARCTRAMAVHHAVGISRQRNSGYSVTDWGNSVSASCTVGPVSVLNELLDAIM